MDARRLRPDNFTPPSRTPWGGTKIVERYKADLCLGQRESRVGESWEISVEPSFPSRFDDNTSLAAAIAADPEGWLGTTVSARYGGQSPLLVKLLDAADNLSVQVHPREGDPALAPDESGKPESWIILEAEPHAGLYLGFRDGVSRQQVARCLAAGGALDTLMNFVPVAPGDAFVIDAGTPHAIGAGVTLIEPQHVTPGRSGVTYRFWDWNRRYDSKGHASPTGNIRELHLARSLAVTNWDAPRGAAFVASCRPVARTLAPGPLSRVELCHTPHFTVELWHGTGSLTIEPIETMWGLVCVAGSVRLDQMEPLRLRVGESAVVPAAAAAIVAEGETLRLFSCRTTVNG